MYVSAVEDGIDFVYYDVSSPPRIEDIWEEYSADYCILSTGTVPRRQSKEIAEGLQIPLDEYGWFKESDTKLCPVETRRKGIFICGFTQAPQSFSSLIEQAKTAALRTAVLLSGGFLQAEGRVSVVDRGKCVACQTCVRTCPYGIPVIRENKAEISPVDCHGCGVCVSNCPNNAIQLVNGTTKQIRSQIDALLEYEERG